MQTNVLSLQSVADRQLVARLGVTAKMQKKLKIVSLSNLGVLIPILILHGLAGGIAALGLMNAEIVFEPLRLPFFAPPAAWFGKIWLFLYLTNAIAVWFVWVYRQRLQVEIIVRGYLFQLLFQALWSWVFFDMGRADVALILIVPLTALVFWLTCVFWRIHYFAGFLMSFYTLWLGIVTLLTMSILYLNGSSITR
jgi:tryptophan-rich sensory protein